MARTAGVGLRTVVSIEAKLLVGSKSTCAGEFVTVAVFGMRPASEGLTRSVATRPAPGANVPTLMVTNVGVSEKVP